VSALTITEALSEIKTIKARIAKKQEAILRFLARDGRLRDPLESVGGSSVFVRGERQSIADLEQRIVSLRTAIQQANQSTTLTLGGRTRSVAEWLNWRRDVAGTAKTFLSQIVGQLSQLRQQAPRQGQVVSDRDTGSPNEIVVALNEQELAKQIESLEEILGNLDGKLSLLNATVTLDV